MSLTPEYLQEEYINKQRSTHDIAKELGVYPNRVRRALIKFGIPLRDHSQAGKVSSPMRGKKHSKETKLAISRSQTNAWAHRSKTKKRKYSDRARKRWAKLSNTQKRRIIRAYQKGLRKASKKPSRLERALAAAFADAGIRAQYKPIIKLQGQKSQTQVRPNLLLPESEIAILVYGPRHFKPLWGADNLLKTKETDARRERLIRQADKKIIRVCHLGKRLSYEQINRVVVAVLGVVCELSAQTAGESWMDVFWVCEINVDKLEK